MADNAAYAYVAWNADGVRVLDLSGGGRPTEVGFYVPADTADPTGTLPPVAHVTGVALAGRNIVVTDANSGLYVLAYRPSVGTAGNDLLRGTPGPTGSTVSPATTASAASTAPTPSSVGRASTI